MESRLYNVSPGKWTILSVTVILISSWLQLPIAKGEEEKKFPLDPELILTEKEKNVLEKFKAAVYKNISQDFMKQDLFMLRWIRSKHLDVDEAVKNMFSLQDFWKTNRLDKILEEDFSEVEDDYPFFTIRDRKQRPVAFGGTTNGWNVRRGILQGKRVVLMRYIYKIILGLNDDLVKTQKTMPNVTSFDIIMNLEGFNLFEHACVLCVSTYISLLDAYERFLPQHAHEIMIINTPQAFYVLLDMLKPVLSKHTRDRLKIFGPDKMRWKSHLDKEIDPAQLPWDFGGSKKY